MPILPTSHKTGDIDDDHVCDAIEIGATKHEDETFNGEVYIRIGCTNCDAFAVLCLPVIDAAEIMVCLGHTIGEVIKHTNGGTLPGSTNDKASAQGEDVVKKSMLSAILRKIAREGVAE
jgi:hypothetical protein